MIILSCDLYPEGYGANKVCLKFEKHIHDDKLITVSLTSARLEAPLVFDLDIKEMQSVLEAFRLCNS